MLPPGFLQGGKALVETCGVSGQTIALVAQHVAGTPVSEGDVWVRRMMQILQHLDLGVQKRVSQVPDVFAGRCAIQNVALGGGSAVQSTIGRVAVLRLAAGTTHSCKHHA